MSRIGRMPIKLPANVQITQDGQTINVKGPKGQLQRTFPEVITIEQAGTDGQRELQVARDSNEPAIRALHGLSRSLLNNMVVGVTEGYKKGLELTGIGYRLTKDGNDLVLNVGFSHPVRIAAPQGINFTGIETLTPTAANQYLSGKVTVEGIDKELVGEIAAKIRQVKPAEPYKGKGLKYTGEVIRRKAGKAGKAGGKGKK
jgi:large subunit ribosomal protein L6